MELKRRGFLGALLGSATILPAIPKALGSIPPVATHRGVGTGATFTVASVGESGAITSVNVLNAGSGYTTSPMALFKGS